MRALYTLLWYLATPLLAAWLLLLAFRDTGWRHGWRERFGFLAGPSPGGIWVHAASVGEVQASFALLRALRERWPDLPLTLTSFTPSGKAHALRQLPDGVRVALLPFDLPGAVSRFISRLEPRLLIVIETELWPNLYAAMDRVGIPLLLVSARVTERGARRYGRWRSLVAQTLARPAVIGTQTDADADRLERLGASPMRVTVTGNIKFDLSLPPGLVENSRTLATELGIGGRPVWIAASTHPGEEAQVLAAHARVMEAHPDALLVLAPRHPGRGDEIAHMVRSEGLDLVRRSSMEACTPETRVFLLDTLGELGVFYGLCDIAFIGGSLVPLGGHNLLEPAALALPLVCGPHVEHVAGMHALLVAAGALNEVADAQALGATVSRLLSDAERRARQGEAALAVLERNRGAVQRVIQLAEGLLGD